MGRTKIFKGKKVKWQKGKKNSRAISRQSLFTFLLFYFLPSVEYWGEGTFAVKELLGLFLDSQLPEHIKVLITALHAEPLVLHANKGNAGNQ